jgi:Flp pilus assembly protein TadG
MISKLSMIKLFERQGTPLGVPIIRIVDSALAAEVRLPQRVTAATKAGLVSRRTAWVKPCPDEMPRKATNCRTTKTSNRREAFFQFMRGQDGTQLFEFAIAMPLLVVLAVGVIDFGQAYQLKQNLVNAAREAARITVSNPVTSLTCTGAIPCSIQAASDAAKQYLVNAAMNQASCINPGSASASGQSWTYSCNGVTLVINRGLTMPIGGGIVAPSTQVTLSYPYTWTFGNIIGLLVPSSAISLPATLTTVYSMQNLT